MMNYSSRPPEEPAVHAQDLTVVRGSRTVLRGLGFTVPRGRITGLLGPSGCGKSTLMRAVVGTQAKVTGTLDVLGRPAGHPSLRTRIGYVTQAPSVYDDLTVDHERLSVIPSYPCERTRDARWIKGPDLDAGAPELGPEA